MPDEEVDDAVEAGLPLEAPETPTLEILRHSAAHLMAAAVVELFPGAQYDVGPSIQDGFFYMPTVVVDPPFVARRSLLLKPRANPCAGPLPLKTSRKP